MEKESIINLLGIVGLILSPSALIEVLDPYIKYPSTIVGIVILGLYIKWYYDEKLFGPFKVIKNQINQIEEKIMPIKERLARIEGWQELAENIFTSKGKKGAIDPITLIVILLIIIIIIIWLQRGG